MIDVVLDVSGIYGLGGGGGGGGPGGEARVSLPSPSHPNNDNDYPPGTTSEVTSVATPITADQGGGGGWAAGVPSQGEVDDDLVGTLVVGEEENAASGGGRRGTGTEGEEEEDEDEEEEGRRGAIATSGSGSASDSAYDSESSSVIRLSNGMVLYLREVDTMLALVCLARSHNFRKKSLIDYNIGRLREALGALVVTEKRPRNPVPPPTAAASAALHNVPTPNGTPEGGEDEGRNAVGA